MTSLICCALAAKISSSSAGLQSASDSCSTQLRICSESLVPPGSRVKITRLPSASRSPDKRDNWVLFPAPSPPSKLMSFPVNFVETKC